MGLDREGEIAQHLGAHAVADPYILEMHDRRRAPFKLVVVEGFHAPLTKLRQDPSAADVPWWGCRILIRHAHRLSVLRKRIYDRSREFRCGWSQGPLRDLPRLLVRGCRRHIF